MSRISFTPYLGAGAGVAGTLVVRSLGSAEYASALGFGALAAALLYASRRLEGWWYDSRILFSDNMLCAICHCLRVTHKLVSLDPLDFSDREKIAELRQAGSRVQERLWGRAVAKNEWEVEHIQIPRSAEDGGGHVPVVLHRPKKPKAPGPMPLIVFFHGGGMVIGSAKDRSCGGLLDRCAGEVVVASVDYRMGPEDPHPAGAVDALIATSWLASNCERFGSLRSSICLGGTSAGGYLVAVTAQQARDKGIAIKFAYMHVPGFIHYGATSRSFIENGGIAALPTEMMIWFCQAYFQNAKHDRRDPMASPILGSLEGLPPCMVVTCTADALRDDGIEYYEALKAAGVDVEHRTVRGSHTFGAACNSKDMDDVYVVLRRGIGF